jgi:polysaccharide pyruvyl transferase WcaK-like protein
MEETRSLDSYFQTMSSLDLLIGMRLHSSLIALRFGVPSINISYTLKGKDIMEHIGLKGNVIKIEEFIESSTTLKNRVTGIIHHLEEEREKVNTCVKQAIKVNTTILDSIFNSGFD